MAFLRARPEALSALVSHVDTASVAEVVARLLGADDAMGLPARELAWLRESGVLRALLEQLNPSPSGDSSASASTSAASTSSSSSLVADAQRHAAAVLAAVVRAHGSPLLSAFAERDFVDALLERAFAKGAAPSVQALEVAVALLEPKEPPADPYFLSPAASAAAAEIDIATKDAAVAGVVARLDDLVALLDAPPATSSKKNKSEGGEKEEEASSSSSSSSPSSGTNTTQLTPYGVLAPPLGLTRIKAVALLVALLRSGRTDAVAGVVASGAVSKCLDLFLAYPFNNLLHHHVAALLLTALDGVGHEEAEEEEEEEEEEVSEEKRGGGDGETKSDKPKKEKPPPTGPAALLAHVLRDVNLPQWLALAPAEVRPIPLPGDARAASGKRQPLRAGYLGHVTHLGNRLLALASNGNAAIAEALASEPTWQPWADGDLAARTQRDDPDGWECGRPAPPSFGGGLMGADSLGAEGDAYDGWGAPVSNNNQRNAGGGGIGGLVGASAGDSSDEEEDEDDDSDDDDDDGDEEEEDEGDSRGGGIRVPRRGNAGRGAAGGNGSGNGSGNGGGAGALDLQELAEAAASVGALRISGGDISAAAAAAASASNGSPTLSSSDDDDDEEEDNDLSDSSSSSSDSSDEAVSAAVAALAAATTSSAPSAPPAPAPAAPAAAAPPPSASSSEAASPDWAAFPEIEGEGAGGEKKDPGGEGGVKKKKNKGSKGGGK